MVLFMCFHGGGASEVHGKRYPPTLCFWLQVQTALCSGSATFVYCGGARWRELCRSLFETLCKRLFHGSNGEGHT